jgi:hypothetical protein
MWQIYKFLHKVYGSKKGEITHIDLLLTVKVRVPLVAERISRGGKAGQNVERRLTDHLV